MATQKNWNLMYVAGNPDIFKKVRSDAGNPLKRSDALTAASKVAEHGWRVWVEHKETGQRIFESELETKYVAET